MHSNLVYNNQRVGLTLVSGGRVFNNTVYGTTPGVGKSGYCMESHFGTLESRNNICFNNAINTIACFSGGNGSTNVSHNLFTNPSFVDAAKADFRVRPGSPVINAGVTMPEVTHDFAGISRLQNQPYDIGAYEYIATGSLPPEPSDLTVTP